MALANILSQNPVAVKLVVGTSADLKVVEVVVSLVSILVVYLHSIRNRSDECLRNHSVNGLQYLLRLPVQAHNRVSIAVELRPSDHHRQELPPSPFGPHPSLDVAHAAHIGHLVQPFPVKSLAPFFISDHILDYVTSTSDVKLYANRMLSRLDSIRLIAAIDSAPARPIPIDPHDSSTLPEIPRLVYRMHDVEGLGIKEIAGVMAIRPAREKRALGRAQAMQRARLA